MGLRVILFGATGMVGRGVLLECLADNDVDSVLAIGRRGCGVKHDKLQEIEHADFLDYSAIENQLAGYDACFFCLGVSSAGMPEADYHRVTYDYAIKAAEAISGRNPNLRFCLLSGSGSDITMESKMMWARVKGKTENDLKSLLGDRFFSFRPALIQPGKGVKPSYKLYYALMPVLPILKLFLRKWITTTDEFGRAMLTVAKNGSKKWLLENWDIVSAGKA